MKSVFGLVLLLGLPIFVQANDVRINVDGPRVQGSKTTITFGSRDKRGYYWDGNQWRDPDYWEKNQGKGKGNSGCPPGQAKKGKC
ncbi:hypothetical protein AT959_08670 [Dechloromonas denitrificans]|uniref:DUF2502 domain-containing protein n=1 Tax=Dechloromonas denitrificans TaxID=281362 RepID=A0A133XIM7_9RHOO|nr:DUF2502 domain-containing protein [Dechloromonas denitrificans]KXB30792.1 hypothetical protein AT959_08670 [Dechloromonas denitrificans]